MSGTANVPGALRIGNMIEHPRVPGIGRIAAADGAMVKIDCFESVAAPVVGSCWVPANECRKAQLLLQTRVYWQDPDSGNWRAGRVVGGDPSRYFVRLPNSELDFMVPEDQLRVRWDRPVADPVGGLVVGANESAYFRDARLPMLRSLVAQRAACAGASAILSSAVEIFPHQIHAVLTVISDPVQRYLLADEVGLGKTIEAGLVIRQVLLDQPRGQVAVVAPAFLRQQWQRELREKFFVDDFPNARLVITAHETPEKWHEYRGFDLIVVDEAHQLVQVDDPAQSPYRELSQLAHPAHRLLLLSATPVTSRFTTHLALLHLLDPDIYRWEDQAAFRRKFEVRKQLANAVYALDPEFESLLPSAICEVAELIPADPRFRRLADALNGCLSPEGDLLEGGDRVVLASRVEALRAHISETYRLHRRMIRHRRVQVLAGDDESVTLPFEVTGREDPQAVLLDSPGHEGMQDCLLAWQERTANWLYDHDEPGLWNEYGQALAVLTSRADGASGDLANALRWRLSGDTKAADQAGLTDEERQLLRIPAVVPAEHEVLRLIAGQAEDHEAAAVVRVLLPIFRKHGRVVVFCGPGMQAAVLSDHLRRTVPARRFDEHTQRRDPGACESAVRRWRADGGVLIADDSADDGLNLQDADAVVHCRLPWSPNRLEQRIGRVDRYGGDTQRVAARQYVLAGPGGEYTFLGAWLALLTGAFGVFAQSVSALQDTIDQGLPAVWAAGAADGPEGLTRQASQIREDLARERREIDGMDMLESVHDSGSGARDIAASIGALETGWRAIESAVVRYAGDGDGGLRFAHHSKGARDQIMVFERGSAAPLLPPRLFARAGIALSPSVMEGGFNRTSALRIPGTRLLRTGNPFIDMLAKIVAVDDRGQAAAFWRRDPGMRGEPTAYFGMDFLVEADIEAALRMTSGNAEREHAVRRQADQAFEPFMSRVWIPAGGDNAIDGPELVKWLDRAYSPALGDVNLNPERIGRLLDLFGGPSRFARAARAAESSGRRELARTSDIAVRSAEARERGWRAIAVQRVQAEARQFAGRLITDTESYLADVGVAEALVGGLRQPHVRLVSVTCLVRGELRAVS